jgi:hypothetical protein
VYSPSLIEWKNALPPNSHTFYQINKIRSF